MRSKTEHIRRLLIEKIAETISETDNQWIEQEIRSNEHTRRLWEDIRSKMQTSAAQAFLQRLDADRSWEDIASQLQPLPLRRRSRIYAMWWSAAAAVLLLGIAVALYVFNNHPARPVADAGKGSPQPPAPAKGIELKLSNGRRINLSDSANRRINLGHAQLNAHANGAQLAAAPAAGPQEWSTLDVPPRLDYKMMLADGTEVWLNSASSLRFPLSFPGSAREVFLEGEAFFKVARRQQQPFIVHAGETEIRVLGTSFNVQSYDRQRPVTSLVEGAVIAKAKGDAREVKLQPGYQALFDPATGFALQPFKAATDLAWMEGAYYFKRTALRDIAPVLERWFGVKVVFDDPRLAGLAITGGIEKNKPLDIFLSSLQTTAGVSAHLEQGVLHLK